MKKSFLDRLGDFCERHSVWAMIILPFAILAVVIDGAMHAFSDKY